jgi:predicted dehydrogenase
MSEICVGVIGVDHSHIFDQVAVVQAAGARVVGFYSPEDGPAAEFSAQLPDIPRVSDARVLLEDAGIALILSAAVSSERCGIALAAMRHGKDVMVDKPGMVTFDQLAELRRVQAETGRIYSIYYSEHFHSRVTIKALELVEQGRIGQVLHVVGLGPHRLRKESRPAWFFERARYGGILTDIASHQFEQFLAFAGVDDARILSATVANRANPDTPELQDFGDAHLMAGHTTGYIRVDWFTPDGLPTWGDGRLFVMGTQGTIELRKYIDIAGRPGKDHLFLTDKSGVTHMDCEQVEKPLGPALMNDIRDRTQTAMSQARCFKAMELALTAQALAEQSLAEPAQVANLASI